MKTHNISNNMRKKVIPGLVLSLLIAISIPGLAHSVPADPPAGSSLQQRIDFRKNEYKIVIDPKDEQRLKTRCIAIQAIYRNFQQELAPKISNYQKRYQSIDAKLLLAIGKLKLAERDTLELEKQRSAFVGKVTVLDSLLVNYRQSIDDVVVMNCQADLVGFKSLIQTTRGYHDSVRVQTTDIRSYIVDTVKSTMAGHITALQPKTTE